MGSAFVFSYALIHPGCTPATAVDTQPQPEEFWLKTMDNLQIKSWYYPPQNQSVIITMGGMQGALGDRLPKIDFLLKSGYGVLQIDTRACAKPKSKVTLGRNEIYDALAAVDFLSKQPKVEHIGAMGFSMGAVALIRTAAQENKIEALIAEGGYYNLGDDFIDASINENWLYRLFLYSIANAYWLQTGIDPWNINPIDDLPAISPRPVFLIYGEYEATSGKAMQQFHSALSPKSLWIIPHADHGTNHDIAGEEYEQRIIEFFDQSLLGE